MSSKILIEVRSGTVVSIGTNLANLQIVIVDHDKVYIGENPVSEILRPDWVAVDMYECMDNDNPADQEIRNELKKIHF